MGRRPHFAPRLHPRKPETADPRDARTLSSQENADLCAGCVKCCSYITIQIDTPRAAWEYDQWIWALYHKGVSLYVEKPESWSIHFETVCEHLNEAGRCAIHGRHPVLCRDYDPRTCERRLPLADVVAWFDTGDQFEAWIERMRPAHYRRLISYRNRSPKGAPVADAHADARMQPALLQIGNPSAHPRRRLRT